MSDADDRSSAPWWVACLCAEWCGVCREFRPAFLEQARAHPGLRFAWVDVEDEADAMGDVDIETFPSLLVGRGGQALFLGAIPPSGAGLARLLATLRTQPHPAPGLADSAQPLLQRLLDDVLPQSLV